MKDIIIKGVRIKKELIILGVCLVASIGLNIYSIAKYETDWSELIGQLHIVLLLALLLYLLVGGFRLILYGIYRMTKLK